jgi:hypothetical protein
MTFVSFLLYGTLFFVDIRYHHPWFSSRRRQGLPCEFLGAVNNIEMQKLFLNGGLAMRERRKTLCPQEK